ncbi:MAG: nucleotidyltransferase domain-containing protein [Oscillospiraceae bacterium]|jgi:predicted nucleotidyltransferase|nr:nucleotidyltransferase domain-containing protein [Oscillospiraceae bacterium]
MAVDYEAVTTAAKQYADSVRRNMAVDRIVLFGSYAKRAADTLSDVDICVFFPTFGDRKRTDVIGDLLKLTHDYDVFIEPIAFPTSEIERGNPFVEEVLSSGVEL